MAQHTTITYRFTRDGDETFTIGENGLRVTDSAGKVTFEREMDIPADVIASTVVDLSLSGWTLAPEV